MHIARLARRAGGAAALAGCLTLGGLMAPAAFAQGNDGTVDLAAPPPANGPHVDCIFDIEFFSFDDGLEATVTFTGQPPTGGGDPLTETVPLEETTGGGNDLVGQQEFDLSSFVEQLGEPQPNQGFHIKVQVDVPSGTHSTAFSKYKVFWVECAPAPTTQPPTTQPPTTQPPSKAPTSEVPKPEGSETPAAVPTEVPAGADSAGSGGSAAGLLGLAAVIGGVGAGAAVFARRRFLHDS
jgi:hypothetical protein